MQKLIDRAMKQTEKESWQEYQEKAIRINVIKDGIGISRAFTLENTRHDATENERKKQTVTQAINAFTKFRGAKIEIYEITINIKRIQ